MDGVVTAGLLTVAALVAWRWWLEDRAAAREHEAALRALVVKAEETEIRQLPEKVASVERRLKELEWRK